MSNFIGRPPFSNSLWVGIETMQFHIAQTKIFLRTPSFPIQGVPMNNLAPMKNCPGGVQGNLNWMPGYWSSFAGMLFCCTKLSVKLPNVAFSKAILSHENCMSHSVSILSGKYTYSFFSTYLSKTNFAIASSIPRTGFILIA